MMYEHWIIQHIWVTWNGKISDLKLVIWLMTSPKNWWLKWTGQLKIWFNKTYHSQFIFLSKQYINKHKADTGHPALALAYLHWVPTWIIQYNYSLWDAYIPFQNKATAAQIKSLCTILSSLCTLVNQLRFAKSLKTLLWSLKCEAIKQNESEIADTNLKNSNSQKSR